ncbi:MAG: RNA polymerase sigma factor [bacterium]
MNDYKKYDDTKLCALLGEKKSISNEAFNVLYSRYSAKLKSYCLFRTENRDEAEELHQETWLKFHSYAVKGNCKSIVLPAYLFVIARNLNIDKHRIANNKNLVSIESINYNGFADPLNLESEVENKEMLSIVMIALNQLSEKSKETFILRWFSGLKYSDISEITNESVDCIKQRSSRAMDEIIKILKPIIIEINK